MALVACPIAALDTYGICLPGTGDGTPGAGTGDGGILALSASVSRRVSIEGLTRQGRDSRVRFAIQWFQSWSGVNLASPGPVAR